MACQNLQKNLLFVSILRESRRDILHLAFAVHKGTALMSRSKRFLSAEVSRFTLNANLVAVQDNRGLSQSQFVVYAKCQGSRYARVNSLLASLSSRIFSSLLSQEILRPRRMEINPRWPGIAE